MRNNDIRSRAELREAMQSAIKANDTEAFANVFDEMQQRIAMDMEEVINQRVAEATREQDAAILATRGVRQLTSQEREYFTALGQAMLAKDPKQALSNLDQIMPETTINAVFDELRTEHPLLRRINFVPSGAAVKAIYNANGEQAAAWGELCDEIVKEITSGFKVTSTNLFKLSGFLPVCKEALALGPEWLERYVREVLYEAFANGLEAGIVSGTGKDMPIGMDRQVGPDVVIVGGEYPEKDPIAVADMSLTTVGTLLASLAEDANGKSRTIRDVILLCNPGDYYAKVLPATRMLGSDGIYRDILPFPMDIIPSIGVAKNKAILGLSYRYFAAAGANSQDGIIDYSDHYQFLQDKRFYLIKGFATGFPMDDNAFLVLDISALQSYLPEVAVVDKRAPLAPDVVVSSDISDSVDLLGKVASDLQTNIAVGAAAITGTLKYVTGYTGFSGDVAEQSGNYLALHVTASDGATTTVQLIGGHHGPKTLDADGLVVLRIESTDEVVRFVSTKDGQATVKSYALTGVTLATQA